MVALARPLAVRPQLPVGLGYTTGKWYAPSVEGVMSAANIALDEDAYVPFLCRKTQAFDRIALYNTGAATFNIRLGIYADDGGGHPGALVSGSDPGQLTTSGAAGDNANTISVTLTGGQLYWLAANVSATNLVQCIAPSGSLLGAAIDFAVPAASVIAATSVAWTGSRAYGAMPSTATAIGVSRVVYPLIRLRAA